MPFPPSLCPSSLLSLAFSALGCLFHGWVWYPHHSARDTLLSLVALSLQLDQEPQRARAWPILLSVWLTGDALYEFVEGVGIPGRGAVRGAGSGLAGPPCTRTQRCIGAENPSAECRGRPGSHLAPAPATSPSLSVLICELGTAWPSPWSVGRPGGGWSACSQHLPGATARLTVLPSPRR